MYFILFQSFIILFILNFITFYQIYVKLNLLIKFQFLVNFFFLLHFSYIIFQLDITKRENFKRRKLKMVTISWLLNQIRPPQRYRNLNYSTFSSIKRRFLGPYCGRRWRIGTHNVRSWTNMLLNFPMDPIKMPCNPVFGAQDGTQNLIQVKTNSRATHDLLLSEF